MLAKNSFLILLLLLCANSPSRAEELQADTTARPVNSGSSVAPAGAPLPGKGTSQESNGPEITLPPVEQKAPEPKPASPISKHPRIKACFSSVIHPKKTFAKVVFPVVHPKQFGKRCEEDGTNGLLSFLAGCANIGTTCILGARRF